MSSHKLIPILAKLTTLLLFKPSSFFVTARVTAQCDLDCHRGVCTIEKFEANIWSYETRECKCDEGWSGKYCDVQTCPDGRQCMNGSECVMDTTAKNQYVCDCSKAYDDSTYAGLMCEHPATAYCEYGVSVSKETFCTNGGKCWKATVADLNGDVKHNGCDCPKEFEGPHCEYLLGEAPANEAKESTPKKAESSASQKGYPVGLKWPFILFVSLIGAGFLVVLAIYIRRNLKKRQSMRSPKNVVNAGINLALEADGDTMKDVSIDSSEVSENKKDSEIDDNEII